MLFGAIFDYIKKKKVSGPSKKEKPKLASHEKLIICPECKNETLLVSEKAKFSMCVNVNCGHFERKIYPADAIGYSFDSNYGLGDNLNDK